MKTNRWNSLWLAVALVTGREHSHALAGDLAPLNTAQPPAAGRATPDAPTPSEAMQAETLIAEGLALLNREGEPTQQDQMKSIQCFKQAADLGSGPAASLVGAAYLFGVGTERHSTLAVSAQRPAASLNEPHAILLLAQMYSTGALVQHDTKEASALAQKGWVLGITECGRLLQSLGIQPNQPAVQKADPSRINSYLAPKSLSLELDRVLAQIRTSEATMQTESRAKLAEIPNSGEGIRSHRELEERVARSAEQRRVQTGLPPIIRAPRVDPIAKVPTTPTSPVVADSFEVSNLRSKWRWEIQEAKAAHQRILDGPTPIDKAKIISGNEAEIKAINIKFEMLIRKAQAKQ